MKDRTIEPCRARNVRIAPGYEGAPTTTTPPAPTNVAAVRSTARLRPEVTVLRPRCSRAPLSAAAVAAWIGAAYWFTSSTSFANPAITVGRMFSDTFAGIAPASAPAFIAAQVIGGALAIGLIKVLYPGVTPAEAERVVIPHPDRASAATAAVTADGGRDIRT